MDTDAANYSGSLLLRGIAAILFGVAAVFWPGLTLRTLVFLFSVFILVNGVVDIVMGIGKLIHGTQSLIIRILTLLFGFIEVGVGVYLLRHTYVRLSLFILLVGFSFLIRGIFEIIQGLFQERGPETHKVMTIIMGTLAALAGAVILMQPVSGGIAFVWVMGLYALITGPLLIALSMELKKS